MHPGTLSGAPPLRRAPRCGPAAWRNILGTGALPPPPVGRDIEEETRRGTSGESLAGPASSNQGQGR
ncbi:hypothetical protein NDU88_005315 [Pleurodeles waltl]|uniref:Uncharacterized protein n=1 Tax=Pleurodeles waltl TaxID=8319 RepID=A0AAV7UHQ9_PLEWA|nr:hypothetical protein NDU88_005315 [Pleurodeles waltl]